MKLDLNSLRGVVESAQKERTSPDDFLDRIVKEDKKSTEKKELSDKIFKAKKGHFRVIGIGVDDRIIYKMDYILLEIAELAIENSIIKNKKRDEYYSTINYFIYNDKKEKVREFKNG